MTKMAILGRGSMRDKHKEEEMRVSCDPKYSHFNDDLHVEITAFAPPAEAHARIAYALAEVRKFLVPDYNDEIRQEQMREMQLLNSPLMPLAAANSPPQSEAQSPTHTPPPSVTNLAKTLARGGSPQQNGRNLQHHLAAAAAYSQQQNGRNNFLYGQQFLLHPAFRGLPARSHGVPLAGTTGLTGWSTWHQSRLAAADPLILTGSRVSLDESLPLLGPHVNFSLRSITRLGVRSSDLIFPGHPTGSILNRLRPMVTAPTLAPTNPRLSPSSLTKHHRNNILSILAGGPRSVYGVARGPGDIATMEGAPTEPMLMCATTGGEDSSQAPDEDVTMGVTSQPINMFGLYENYAAVAAAASAASAASASSVNGTG
uniref:Uncharacterized protein n=1 Tax=Timema bartmani TaxID=61472 RepID=A0A7R9HXC1_9NEOP|nr:unnamed protein product [Timema bartmani]